MPRLTALLLVALTLAGCAVQEPVAIEPRDRTFLLGVLEAAPVDSGVAPVSSELSSVPELIRARRRGVVQIKVEIAPSFLGYLGGLWNTTRGAVGALPNPWALMAPPFYLLFGWVPELFKESSGTGFVIGRDGDTAWILTAAHVIGEIPQRIRLTTWNGQPRLRFPPLPGAEQKEDEDGWIARVALIDHELDYALLRAYVPDGQGAEVLPLGSASDDLLGRFCVALGYPSRAETEQLGPRYCTATLGLVSSVDVAPISHKQFYGAFDQPDGVLQTDAAINPGNSGGPLLDLEGRVIGINNSIVSGADNIGYAIPIDWIRDALRDALEAGQP